MSEDHTVSFSLEINVEPAHQSLRVLQMVLFRLLGVFRRLGLPDNIDAGIAKMQRFIAVMNQARLAAIAFQTASGPMGWAMAGIGIATTAFSMADLATEMDS